jgi:hypothetical protein
MDSVNICRILHKFIRILHSEVVYIPHNGRIGSPPAGLSGNRRL